MVTNSSSNTPTAAAGKVLQGAGIGTASTFSTATYPSASGTARKMLVSDGTNNVYSTETWAVPGSSGNVLTSNGTNWLSSAPTASGIITVTGTLSSAQIKSLNGTPITVIAAPGGFMAIKIVNASAKFNYGGGGVFVAGAAQTIALYYTTATSIMTLLTNANIVASSRQVSFYSAMTPVNGTFDTIVGNKAVTIYNPVATEISGDVANFSSITYSIVYMIV